MSTLWLLLVLVCTAIYTLLLPIAPNDFWYHARAGAEIIASGKVPTIALFSSSAPPGTPYFYQSWIAEIALFETLRRGGLAWIVVLRTLCLTLSFALIQFAVWRRVQRIAPQAEHTWLARLAALSTLLAFALSASNMDIRPQTFSVPLFCAFVFAIYEWPFLTAQRRAVTTAVLGLLMMLWANTHGAFFTGLILLAVLLCGEVALTWSTRGSKAFVLSDFFGSSLSKQHLGMLFLLLLLSIGATLINPRGLEIYSYVFLLARDKSSQKFIQEWQTPGFTDWYGALFFLTLLALAALTAVLTLRSKAVRQTRVASGEVTEIPPPGCWGVRFSESLVVTVLAIMALRDARSIIWFGLFAAPLFAALLANLLRSRRQNESVGKTAEAVSYKIVPQSVQAVNTIIALLLVASTAWFLPWVKPSLPLPPEYLKNFAPTPRGTFPRGFATDPPLLLERSTPVEAVAFLDQNPPHQKLWNDFAFGSYLVWATLYEARLAPNVDPRVEMHPLPFWQEYGRITGGPPDAAQRLKAGGFSDVLLDAAEQPKLLGHLQSNNWRVVWPVSAKRKTPREGAVLLRHDG